MKERKEDREPHPCIDTRTLRDGAQRDGRGKLRRGENRKHEHGSRGPLTHIKPTFCCRLCVRAAGTEIAHGRNPSSLGGGPPGEGEGRRRKGGFAGACHVYRPLQNNQSKLNENAILLNFIFIFISLLNRHISITHSHQAPLKSGCGGQASIPLQTEDVLDNPAPYPPVSRLHAPLRADGGESGAR